ncbi:MAG: carbohydrate deacetylase [Coprobacillus sp.]
MVKIINNADDFGYSNAINYGIIDSYLNGMLTSTTLMPGMPGFEHAVELAKKNEGLGVGVHLTLTCGKPVLKGHKTLVDENGYFKKLSFYKDETTVVDDEEVYREWKAQIEKVYAAGIIPTHLDSHHHSHTFKNNPSIVKRLAQEYGLPVRNSFLDVSVLKAAEIITNDVLIDPWCEISKEFETADKKLELLITSIKQQIENASKTSDVIEVMWHPAYLDINIITGSSFAYPRIYEVEALQNDELIKYTKENFELCTFQDI